jgi:fluoride ion exporter CrcB/FEX
MEKKLEKKERGFFAKLFCEKNEPSSKRFVGIVGSMTLFGTLFANSFSHLEQAPSEALVNAVALLSFGALGITGAERIFSKKESNNEN